MIDYEVGAVPSRPLTIVVRDEMDNPVNTVGYSAWRLEMMDTDDNPVDMTGAMIYEIPNAIGAYSLIWPRNRSLFKKKGIYVLRMVLETPEGSKDITRTAEIRVREFGRIK